jgi:hypothetical protein
MQYINISLLKKYIIIIGNKINIYFTPRRCFNCNYGKQNENELWVWIKITFYMIFSLSAKKPNRMVNKNQT